tara:strand:+ start:258 stop:1007 length:750 start_codon:yes stop_codon:yes gene_type:complete
MNRSQKRTQEKTQKKNELAESFQMTYVLHKPWADILFDTKLPPAVLEKMIQISDEILSDSNRTNWGNNLAGQIKDEPLVPPQKLKEQNLTDFFGNMVLEYVHQCNLQKVPPNQHQNMELIKNNIQVTLNSMWIVEQQPGEYNPIHVHTNCDISSVMYLKVPKFLESEKPERADDGTIYFIGGSGANDKLKMNSLKVNPQPGDFFIFPSHLMHTVYPYKTNDNFARRSVSFNASFEYKGVDRDQARGKKY